MLPNHSAIFVSRDIFDCSQRMVKGAKKGGSGEPHSTQVDLDKSNGSKSTQGGSGFLSKIQKVLNREEILSEAGMEKVVKSLKGTMVEGDEIVSTGLPSEATAEECKKLIIGRQVIQLGPTRESSSTGASESSCIESEDSDGMQSRKKLSLHRTQDYCNEFGEGEDFSAVENSSGQSSSSSTTLLDGESESETVDWQSVVECTEMGIDPHAMFDKIEEIRYELGQHFRQAPSDVIVRAMNVLLASTSTLPGCRLNSVRLYETSLIGTVRQTKQEKPAIKRSDVIASPVVTKKEAPPAPTKIDPQPVKTGVDRPKANAAVVQSEPSVKKTEPSEEQPRFALVIPMKRGGKPARVAIPVKFNNLILTTEESPSDTGIQILKGMALYKQYIYAANYKDLIIEETQE